MEGRRQNEEEGRRVRSEEKMRQVTGRCCLSSKYHPHLQPSIAPYFLIFALISYLADLNIVEIRMLFTCT